MDIASLIGFLLGVGMFVFGVVVGDNGIDFSALGTFAHLPSLLITIGGSMAGVLASHKMEDFIKGLQGFTKIFKETKSDIG